MNKKIGAIFLTAMFSLGAAAARAEWSLGDWLKSLEAKVQGTEKKHSKKLAAAAAIRGDKQEDSAAKQLYWKGKKDAQPVSQQELDDFKAALAQAQGGKTAEAEKSFNDFLAKYPNSSMTADAKQTLALLQAPK